MTLNVWAAYALTELTLSLLPGPAVLLICSQAFKSGQGASARGALGIVTGNVVYFVLSAVGLFQAIRIAGAAYLVYVGMRLTWTRADAHSNTDAPKTEPAVDGRRCFLQAFLTQLLNPKALLFFAALLPQFVSPAKGDLTLQFGLLGITSIGAGLSLALRQDAWFGLLRSWNQPSRESSRTCVSVR